MAMSSDQPVNPLDERRKAQEEEYFRKQNAEAAAKLKAKLELEESGVQDEGLVETLMKAGFDTDSARALYLVPVLEVAWADGKIQSEEKQSVIELLEERGIEKNSKAYQLVLKWLSGRPTDHSYLQAKSFLEPYITELKKSGKPFSHWVIKAANKVAQVTGGLFGIGWNMVSKKEEAVLKQIARKYGS